MKEIKVIIENPWWHGPLFIAVFSAILTGVIFAFALEKFNQKKEKKNLMLSIKSELSSNYNALKYRENITSDGLENKIQEIKEMRKRDSYNKELTDLDWYVNSAKNAPYTEELSTEIWNILQPQIAKYPKEYVKFKNIYSILKQIIRHSKILNGEISNPKQTEIIFIQNYNSIRTNSALFIKKIEESL